MKCQILSELAEYELMATIYPVMSASILSKVALRPRYLEISTGHSNPGLERNQCCSLVRAMGCDCEKGI